MRIGNILIVIGIYVATIGLSLIFMVGEIPAGAAFVFVGANMIYAGRFPLHRARIKQTRMTRDEP